MALQEKLDQVAEQLRREETPTPVSVRDFLAWGEAQRRGYWIVKKFKSALDAAGLITEPDFEGAYINSLINFRLRPIQGAGQATLPPLQVNATGTVTTDAAVHETPLYITGGIADPTYRIGKLAAANRAPLSVNAQTPLTEAVTLMMLHDYSQLPVMQGERVVRGVVSWQSIGSRLALGRAVHTAGDCMEPATEISADASLFAALPIIVERDYVLIRGAENRITGIVTTSDLSLQFQQLAEPFLLLGEIENHVRRLIDGKFTLEEVRAACDPDDLDREVNSVADLTFGEYVRLLENPDMWEKTGLSVDRATFVRRLEQVREIRNNVMHFDPDGVAEDDQVLLRQFAQFLQTLQAVGAT